MVFRAKISTVPSHIISVASGVLTQAISYSEYGGSVNERGGRK